MEYPHFLDKLRFAFVTYPDKVAFVTCDEKTISWHDYYCNCSSFANGLVSNNIKENDGNILNYLTYIYQINSLI